jgi:two-component system, NarL family, invasion response regulator UvrY
MLKTNASVAIIDDHILLRNGLANLIRGLETYAILFEASNGKDITSSNNSGPGCRVFPSSI